VGRRKKKQGKFHYSGQFQKKPTGNVSFQEQEFRETASFLEFILPRQLDEWKSFFINEERFLSAANKWLEDRCNGVKHPRIEDDVDKGQMKRSAPSYARSWRDDVHLDPEANHKGYDYEDNEDYWGGWWHGNKVSGHGSMSRSWGLPAVPKIKAPEGLSHVDMATVF
jgi:hypothetical protein